MIDNNNVFTLLSLDAAIANEIALAQSAGITVTTGSIEQQIANWLAQFDVYMDSKLFQSYQLEFNPVGSDIDLQNPGNPRLQASISSGFVLLTNNTASPIFVDVNTPITASNGNIYTTGANSVTVAASPGTATITVFSTVTGIDQNLPLGQTFTGITGLTITNPQPFTNGRDTESDTEYLTRIISLKTNNTSQQATGAALKELTDFYQKAVIYVNNTSNTLPLPVEVPANGYLPVVQFASGVTAGAQEIQQALQILANRFEFGNPFTASSSVHPIFSGTIFTGPFPETFYVVPAQAISSLIQMNLTVAFSANLDLSEKILLATAFGNFIVQNLVDFFGGSQGTGSGGSGGTGAVMNFFPMGSPAPPSVELDSNNLASQGILNTIAPAFSIEQIRALISDENQIRQLPNFEYLSCDNLTMFMTTNIFGEPDYSIDSSFASPNVKIDFKTTALFNDGTSWFDRYVYLDPTGIVINIHEGES